MTQFLVYLTIVPLAFSRTLFCSEVTGFFDATSQTMGRRIVYDNVVLNGIKDVLGEPNDQGDFVCNGMVVSVRYATDDDYKQHSFINPPVIIPIVSGFPWQKKGEILISRKPTRCLRRISPSGVAYVTSYDQCSPIKAMKARVAASFLKNSGGFTKALEQFGHIPIFLAIGNVALSQQDLAVGCGAALIGIVAGCLGHKCVVNALRNRLQEAIDMQALQATSHEGLKTYLDHAQRCPSELVHSAVFVERAQKLLTQRNRCCESVARKTLWQLPKTLQDLTITFLRLKD